MEVVVAAEIVAFEAPIQTVFWLNVGLKPVPERVMFDPGIAFVGEKEVIVGGTVIAVIKVYLMLFPQIILIPVLVWLQV